MQICIWYSLIGSFVVLVFLLGFVHSLNVRMRARVFSLPKFVQIATTRCCGLKSEVITLLKQTVLKLSTFAWQNVATKKHKEPMQSLSSAPRPELWEAPEKWGQMFRRSHSLFNQDQPRSHREAVRTEWSEQLSVEVVASVRALQPKVQETDPEWDRFANFFLSK